MSKSGVMSGLQASKLNSYPTLSGSSSQWLNGSGAFSTIGAAAVGAASSNHNHDATYAAKSHSHSNYAASDHNHDSAYAALNHTHAFKAAILTLENGTEATLLAR